MKKRISLLMAAMLVIAAIMSVSVTAFAYDNVDGSEWFTGATLEADGSVKINISTGFTGANGSSGYRITVFDGDPQLPNNNDGLASVRFITATGRMSHGATRTAAATSRPSPRKS